VRFKCHLIPFLLALATVGAVSAADRAYGDEPTSPASPVTTTLRMRGTIGAYDTAARTLSLVTADGTLRVELARDVRIRRGGSEIDPEALAKLAGYRVAVRYSESGGNKIAESIHVFNRNGRGER
jgi:hypothetical protein